MARIILSGLVDSLTGKLGGTVFQVSNGTLIARTRVSPKNPSSGTQQNRRALYSFLTRNWSLLTQSQRNSWLDPVLTYPDGIERYIASNSMISLTGSALLTDFTDTAQYATFAPLVGHIDHTEVLLIPTDGGGVLPSGYHLLLYASAPVSQGTSSLSFQNSRFITSWPPGTNVGSFKDVNTAYRAVFPNYKAASRIFFYTKIIRSDLGGYGPNTVASGNTD